MLFFSKVDAPQQHEERGFGISKIGTVAFTSIRAGALFSFVRPVIRCCKTKSASGSWTLLQQVIGLKLQSRCRYYFDCCMQKIEIVANLMFLVY